MSGRNRFFFRQSIGVLHFVTRIENSPPFSIVHAACGEVVMNSTAAERYCLIHVKPWWVREMRERKRALWRWAIETNGESLTMCKRCLRPRARPATEG